MIYLTGDVHGEILSHFSYKQYPELRTLTKNDIIIVLGDFGCPWYNSNLGYHDYWHRPEDNKNEHYKLNFLNNKPWKTFIIAGNHENYDLIAEMPHTKFAHANVRQMCYEDIIYENIFYIETPQYMYYQGQKFLLIPGAESHDVDYLFEPFDPNTKKYIKNINKKFQKTGEETYYRIKNVTWWPQEKIDANKIQQLIHCTPDEVNYIFSHDCPAVLKNHWKKPSTPARVPATESEKILQQVYDNKQFKMWVHGHYHNYIEMSYLYTLGLPIGGFWSLNDIDYVYKKYQYYNTSSFKNL